MHPGLQIRVLRENKKMSRELLAELLHISPNTLAKIENGDRTPTLDELKIISKEFDIDPSIFFEKTGQTVITHGDNSPGMGNNNVITMDKELLAALIRVLDKLSEVLEKNER